jgi:hypothetical protein
MMMGLGSIGDMSPFDQIIFSQEFSRDDIVTISAAKRR